MSQRLPDVFSKNRSEEAEEDKWSEFVVPPFIDKLGIKSQSKAIVIIGGRGCGKTTLLRYFCHATQLSPRRPDLPEDALSHIGLYWRADTNFLNAFAGGGKAPEVWRAAFEHVLACELGTEVVSAVSKLNCTTVRQTKYGGLSNLDLSELLDFNLEIGRTLDDLARFLKRSRRRLASWLNNLDQEEKPRFLPAADFLLTLVRILQSQLPYLANSTFAVFIDEYENLREEQQRLLNGLLKHGAKPLIYNIAMKRNGWQTQKTLGPESIGHISDYREIDLEGHLSGDFELFAAELLFFRLAENDPEMLSKLPIIPDNLRDASSVASRYDDEGYKRSVLAAADRLLPRINDRAAANEIFADEKLKDVLLSKIREALGSRKSVLAPQLFVDAEFPEASLLMPALLNRPREEPSDLLEELDKLRRGDPSRFSSTEQLISNNLFGCVNAIYIDARRPSILFSGFSALTLVARGNIRHLLELIHRIFQAYSGRVNHDLPVIPATLQAVAVREASELILGLVKGHGPNGPQLHSLAQSLGSVFRERHRSGRQSEPETNHFTISEGDLSDELRNYIAQAEKWSILFVESETKMKTTGAISSDYVLNPIFSPYFQISFRKKRSLQLTAAQLLTMLEGDKRTRDGLVRELGRKLDGASEHPDLFDEGRP